MEHSLADRAKVMITGDGLQRLIDALAARSYKVLGPRVRDGAIVYDEIARVSDLPRVGLIARRRAVISCSGATIMRCLALPSARNRGSAFCILRSRRCGRLATVKAGLRSLAGYENPPKFAFIGVRACEIHAIAIQDRVFCEGTYPDTAYTRRRRGCLRGRGQLRRGRRHLFLRFNADRTEGRTGFDLALTELLEGVSHAFLVEVGSEHGAESLGKCRIVRPRRRS